MKKIRLGQIGKGSFGKKILSKLNNISEVSVEWVYGSKDKWWESDVNLDWVIIASPNEFHYEQAKHFLQKKVNVFCEKPGTLSTASLLELYGIAEANDICFYVDDVLVYEKIESTNNFIYKKWGGLSANIIDRMAYHHFYLTHDIIEDSIGIPDNVNIITNDINHKIFEVEIKNKKFRYEYDFGWYKEKIHNIKPTCESDALETMLKKVLFKQADFESNCKRSVFATRLSSFVKEKMYGKCAVVGGGIYGVTVATKLAVSGYDVDLYESESQILKRASGINQYRIHRGYHYPRSVDTIKSCKTNEQSFIKYYNQSIVNGDIKHYYGIASEESLVTAEQYLSILDSVGLEWEIVDSLPNCDLTIKVDEKLYDPDALRLVCIKRMYGLSINVRTDKKFDKQTGYKHTIYSTYSSLNDFTNEKQDYQFELCEKPVLKLPDKYKNKSIVIMDGPFMCFDPYSDTGYHLAGNVVHAIHASNIGKEPKIPAVYKNYLNKGLIEKPKYTNIHRFIESSKRFFPDIEKSKYIGSMYTIRTVLPNKDETDERPTIITKQNENYILFSSKIGNCVDAASSVVYMIKNDM